MNLIKQSLPLLSFVIILSIGVYVGFSEIKIGDFPHSSFWWSFFGVLDTSSAVAVAILAFFGYISYIKLEDKISLIFKIAETKELKDLNLSILRKNFTRSEIVGILGMIQKDNKQRFEIEDLKNRNLLEKIHDIQKGKGKELVIKVTQNELEQFKLK